MITTIDQKIAEYITQKLSFNGWEWGNALLICFALVLTVVLCGIVGFEREKRGRSAGLRTHLIIGITSCIIMIISIYGFPKTDNNRDIARLAAQVVTGVGFLGTGAILHTQGGTRGLTTASTIWMVMAIGLACGSMNFILAILGTVLVFVVLKVFERIEVKLSKNKPLVSLIVTKDVPVLSTILSLANEMQLHVTDVASNVLKTNGGIEQTEVIFRVFNEKNTEFDLETFLQQLVLKTNAISVNVMNRH